MKYYYEYKEKNGSKVSGDNLENISIKGYLIILQGVDIVPVADDYDTLHWNMSLDMNKIEYLKIEPIMLN